MLVESKEERSLCQGLIEENNGFSPAGVCLSEREFRSHNNVTPKGKATNGVIPSLGRGWGKVCVGGGGMREQGIEGGMRNT